MKNRHGDEYTFEKVNENTYTIVGDLKYWRYGGREGQAQMDFSDLGFVDPSGGPFIQVGTSIEDRKINRIRFVGEKLFFEVE
jgi:hypothetical protein